MSIRLYYRFKGIHRPMKDGGPWWYRDHEDYESARRQIETKAPKWEEAYALEGPPQGDRLPRHTPMRIVPPEKATRIWPQQET